MACGLVFAFIETARTPASPLSVLAWAAVSVADSALMIGSAAPGSPPVWRTRPSAVARVTPGLNWTMTWAVAVGVLVASLTTSGLALPAARAGAAGTRAATAPSAANHPLVARIRAGLIIQDTSMVRHIRAVTWQLSRLARARPLALRPRLATGVPWAGPVLPDGNRRRRRATEQRGARSGRS